jgi:hypothetical protein
MGYSSHPCSAIRGLLSGQVSKPAAAGVTSVCDLHHICADVQEHWVLKTSDRGANPGASTHMRASPFKVTAELAKRTFYDQLEWVSPSKAREVR